MKEISVDSFTLYEYMYNHRDKTNMFSEPLLAACQQLSIRSHDHARSRYTSELKGAGLAEHVHRKGWQLHPAAAAKVTVFGMDATVTELLSVEKPNVVDQVETPVDVPETPRTVPTDYTGLDLAKQIAVQLLDRLEQQTLELAERKVDPVSEEEKARLLAHVDELGAAKSAVEQQLATLKAQLGNLREQAEVSQRKAETAERELARAMREIADSSGEDIKAAAKRFLGELSRS